MGVHLKVVINHVFTVVVYMDNRKERQPSFVKAASLYLKSSYVLVFENETFSINCCLTSHACGSDCLTIGRVGNVACRKYSRYVSGS